MLWQGVDGIIVSESFVRAIQEIEIIIPSYIINGLDIAVSEENITVSETFYLPTNRPVVHLQGSIIVLNEGIAPEDEWTELSNGAYVSEEGIIVESYFMIEAGKDDRSDDEIVPVDVLSKFVPDAELIESTPKEALSRLFLEDACVRELVVCIMEGLMPVVEYESDKASNKSSWLLNNCDVAFSVPLDQKHGDYEIYYVANKTIKAHQQLLFKLPVGVIDNLPVSILPNASAIEFIHKYVDDTSSSGYSESRIRYTLDDSISNDGWTKVTDRVYILDGELPL